jgi:hypothetical protein
MAFPSRHASGVPGALRPRAPLRVALTAAVVAIVVLAVLLVGHIGGSGSSGTAAVPTPTTTTAGPTANPSATPASTPATLPGGAPAMLPGFTSGPVIGGSPSAVPPLSEIVAVRAATYGTYDRFVIDLGTSPMQPYEVGPQPTPTFTMDPKGSPVTLEGTSGVLIVLRNTSLPNTFAGMTSSHPGLPAIREVSVIGAFEGVVSWALGVDGPGYVRVQTLTGPSRLVVDVQV